MSEYGLKVIGKRIIAEEIVVEEKKSILIVTSAKPTEITLRVLAVGEDIPIQPGQKILVKNGWMHKFKFLDKDVVLVPLEEIIGIIDEKA
jgi:co-chaperonin GroES (HSP10)